MAAVQSSDDGNWNPVEWERAAEELTWERVSDVLILNAVTFKRTTADISLTQHQKCSYS